MTAEPELLEAPAGPAREPAKARLPRELTPAHRAAARTALQAATLFLLHPSAGVRSICAAAMGEAAACLRDAPDDDALALRGAVDRLLGRVPGEREDRGLSERRLQLVVADLLARRFGPGAGGPA